MSLRASMPCPNCSKDDSEVPVQIALTTSEFNIALPEEYEGGTVYRHRELTKEAASAWYECTICAQTIRLLTDDEVEAVKALDQWV